MSLNYIRSVVITDPLIIITTIILGSISLMASFFDAHGFMQHRIARLWSRMLIRIAGVKLKVSGIEKIDPNCSYVFASNHRSLMDTPVVMGFIPVQFRFFAKKGLFSIPFLGTHLRRAGHLPVVRDNPRASLKSLAEGAKWIRERNVSVLLFPEGGRSEGEMRDFKEGAAYLAIKAGVPIVPVGLIGTRDILPMGSIQIMPLPAEIRVGDPIPTEGMDLHDRGRLTEMVRERVIELCDMGRPAKVG